MSFDYQVSVRIGNVTIRPGDLLLGELHGILVIPAALADEVLDKAVEKEFLENSQRKLLLKCRSIYGVYPPNEETRKAYERQNAILQERMARIEGLFQGLAQQGKPLLERRFE